MYKFNRNRFLLGLILLVSLLASGCANQQAKDVLGALKQNNENYRASSINFETGLLGISKSKVIEGLKEAIEKEKLDLKLQVYQRSEEVFFDGIDRELELFDKAMEGPIERISKQKNAAEKANNKRKELELAVQLSATLALYGKEKLELIESTGVKLKIFREEVLKKIDNDFESLEQQMAATEKLLDLEMNGIIEQIKNKNKDQGDKQKAAYEQLDRYLSFPLSAVRPFLKGLLGEKTFQTLQQFSFENKPLGDLFLEKAEKEVNDFRKSLERKTGKLIDEINNAELKK